MAAETALRVRMKGFVDAAVLRRLREDLKLQSNGRLSDDEDVEFGYRDLDPTNTAATRIDLALERNSATSWVFAVTYEGGALPAELIEAYRRWLDLAAERAGLEVVGEYRQPVI